MTTVQDVFDAAICLMDEQSGAATCTADTASYQARTVPILNTLLPALYPFSSTWSGSQPVCPALTGDFQQPLPVDDTLGRSVAPYALAANLLSSEDRELAEWFRKQYTYRLSELQRRLPGGGNRFPCPTGYSKAICSP